MQTTNKVLIRQAKESLKGKWGFVVGSFLIYYLITTLISFIPKVGTYAVLIIDGPFTLGLQLFFLSIARNQEAKIEQIFSGFKQFIRALVAYSLMILYIALWSVLLIVPGIMAALSYSMIFCILNDEPAIGVASALKKSKEMMNGNKWKYFKLLLPFLIIPLIFVFVLVVVITIATINHDQATILKLTSFEDSIYGKLVISSIYVLLSWSFVWMYISSAKFYDDIKPKAIKTVTELEPA